MRKLKSMLVACLLLLSTSFGFAHQQVTVSGVVTSEADNTPLQVSVTVEGTKRGTQTNELGRFTIAASKGEVLQFSGVGYTLNSITDGDNPTINVRLAVTTLIEHFCESAKIDTLVTELSPDDPLLRPYKNAGIQVL